METHIPTYQIKTIEDHLRDGLAAVERRLLQVIQSEVPVLRDASAHLLEAGGKRLRPRLTLLSQLAVGGGDTGGRGRSRYRCRADAFCQCRT